jgi:hypothetical protein
VRILGRWTFDLSASLDHTKRAQPGITPKRQLELNRELGAAFLDAFFVATTDGQVFLKAVPLPPPPQPGQPLVAAVPSGPARNVATGTWTESGGSYRVTAAPTDPHPLYQFLSGPANVRIPDDSLLLEFGNVVLAFDRNQ